MLSKWGFLAGQGGLCLCRVDCGQFVPLGATDKLNPRRQRHTWQRKTTLRRGISENTVRSGWVAQKSIWEVNVQNQQTMSPKLEKGLQKLTCNPEHLGARLCHKGFNNKLLKMEEKPRLLKWKASGLIVHLCESGVQIDWSELENSPTQTENRQPRKK